MYQNNINQLKTFTIDTQKIKSIVVLLPTKKWFIFLKNKIHQKKKKKILENQIVTFSDFLFPKNLT